MNQYKYFALKPICCGLCIDGPDRPAALLTQLVESVIVNRSHTTPSLHTGRVMIYSDTPGRRLSILWKH